MSNVYRHISPDYDPAPPRIIQEAHQLLGIEETPGNADNPLIMGWARELATHKKFADISKVFYGDIVPWCGLFAAIVAVRAGWEDQVPATPLWAQSWKGFGTSIAKDDAALGDVLVFVRKGGGHVGFYVGHDSTHFHVLGGNQTDQVCISRIAKERCIAVRRPKWRTAQPKSVVPYRLSPNGAKTSLNER